jgi:hypothetical protein
MNARTRHARRILRTTRRGPWGKGRNAINNSMQPVYGADGEIMHYRLVNDPWYTRRSGLYRPGKGISHRTKAAQVWRKAHEKSARWDVGHALSDCCGWGNGEAHHDPFAYVGSLVPPRPAPFDEDDEDSMIHWDAHKIPWKRKR